MRAGQGGVSKRKAKTKREEGIVQGGDGESGRDDHSDCHDS